MNHDFPARGGHRQAAAQQTGVVLLMVLILLVVLSLATAWAVKDIGDKVIRVTITEDKRK